MDILSCVSPLILYPGLGEGCVMLSPGPALSGHFLWTLRKRSDIGRRAEDTTDCCSSQGGRPMPKPAHKAPDTCCVLVLT